MKTKQSPEWGKFTGAINYVFSGKPEQSRKLIFGRNFYDLLTERKSKKGGELGCFFESLMKTGKGKQGRKLVCLETGPARQATSKMHSAK